MQLVRNLRKAWRLLEPDAVRLLQSRCPICACGWLVTLSRSELGARCIRCGASAISQSLAQVLSRTFPDLRGVAIYESSARGPLVEWFRRSGAQLTTSEFVPGVDRGAIGNGVRCEDLQALTFADASFDLVTSTEVLEHVRDDQAAFRELHRVLKPGGWMFFTVPLTGAEETVERVRFVDDLRVDVHPPELHADPSNGGSVLCYRNYGRDITTRLASAGFTDCDIVRPALPLAGHTRSVIVARRPGAHAP